MPIDIPLDKRTNATTFTV